MKERNRDHAWRMIVEFGRRRPTSRCRQGAGMSDVGRRKPVGFRPGQEVSCHGMTDISKQLASGRLLGPFPKPPLPHFRSSPLGAVTRKRSSKVWRIHNLSWPRGSSVNDGIPDSEASILYEAFSCAVRDLIQAGPGSLFIKLDLEQAFRQIPVRVEDWHLLGFQWGKAFYHEIALSFGLRSAPYIFNLFAEALHWIIARHLPAFPSSLS